jgi:dienelactone hydrolase
MSAFHEIISALMIAATVCVGAETFQDSACEITPGPVPPKCDLRSMLREHIARRACEMLDAAAKKREDSFASGEWREWRDGVRARVRSALGEMKYGPVGPELNVRPVTKFERDGYAIENVLFESLPGWDVNASVYLPDPGSFPPPWRAIVIPVGHSSKKGESYQFPAQVFARCGYVAVTFDPPGMAGEKQGGNDHFTDGVRCYLTGHSSNRYFVIDALRCIDYLATRPDVDMSRGVGMTGVSGGGTTTLFATLLDDRIRAAGPSCCAVPNARHPILDVYAPCAETLAPGRLADGYDDVDLLAAAIPTPVILMAGAKDEVFKSEWSNEIAASVGQNFMSAGQSERFRYFSDPGGHAYTIAMAVEFVKWMDAWVWNKPERTPPTFLKEQFKLDPPEMLQCNPRLERNIYTVNRDMALDFAKTRDSSNAIKAAQELVHANSSITTPGSRGRKRVLDWNHYVEELMLEPEPGIELPATFIYPSRPDWKGGALLYFDDRGRWTDLRKDGYLSKITGFCSEATDGPAILTVDLRGWGDTKMADAPYEIAGWGDSARWTSYVTAALGDSAFSMRARDGLATLAYLRSRNEIDPSRIFVGGRGMGGAIALHVAALGGSFKGVFTLESLASFTELAVSEKYRWSPEDFFPGVLQHYDIPELAKRIPAPVLILNPLDAVKEPLDDNRVKEVYQQSDPLTIKTELTASDAEKAVQNFISAQSSAR